LPVDRALLADLDDVDRKILVLHYLHELTRPELSEVLDLSVEEVAARLAAMQRRCLRHLDRAPEAAARA